MTIDAINLEVLRHAYAAVADEMNANLVRTAYSPNIKERRDCSCALFNADGEMIAQAESIPVHLGAMPFSVAAAIRDTSVFRPGDIVVLNDPYAGGAHLPDLTFIAPLFVEGELYAFAASRAHHADIGGKEPGSLAGDATEIYQEGLRIPPLKLWKKGKVDDGLLELILANVRTPDERLGDLRAQHAACITGLERFNALVTRYGTALLREGMAAVVDYSERCMRAAIGELPNRTATFEDVLDDAGIHDASISIKATVRIVGETICVNFSGSSPQVAGPVNAVYAVTASDLFCPPCTDRSGYPPQCRLLSTDRDHRAGGKCGQCCAPSICGGRQPGDVSTDRRCYPRGILRDRSRPRDRCLPRDDEQPRDRRHRSTDRQVLYSVRDNWGWVRRPAVRRWCRWYSRAHDEHLEYTGGGA